MTFITPKWFVFLSRTESRAVPFLLRHGADEAWFPVEKYWRTLPRGVRGKVEATRRIAPGYVFALLPQEPDWGSLIRSSTGKITGVICRDCLPLPVPERQMMQMMQVPRSLEIIRERERIAKTLFPGDRARVISVPFADWQVDITRVHEGIARFMVPFLGSQREVEHPITDLLKVPK